MKWIRCTQGVNRDTWTRSKEQLRTSRQEQLRDNGFWLSQIRVAVTASDYLNNQ